MTTQSKPKEIDKKGQLLLRSTLPIELFDLNIFGECDSTPDIDGFLRVIKEKGELNPELTNFQLKSTEKITREKFAVDKKDVNFALKNPAATIYFIADIEKQKVYWLCMKRDAKKLDLKENKGKTIDLRGHEINKGSIEKIHKEWLELSKDTSETAKIVKDIIKNFESNLKYGLGLIYLISRFEIKDTENLFKTILGIEPKDTQHLINQLLEKGIIVKTANFYLVKNDEIGKENLFELIDHYGPEELEKHLLKKVGQTKLLEQFSKIDHPKLEPYFKKISKDLLTQIKKTSDTDEILNLLTLRETFYHLEYKKTLLMIEYAINLDNERILLKTIEMLKLLRYFSPEQVLTMLLRLSVSTNKKIKEEATESIKSLSEYNINALKKLWYVPQKIVIENIKTLPQTEIKELLVSLLTILENLFHTEYGGTSNPEYNKITFHRGALVLNDDLKEIRKKCLEFAKKTYFIRAFNDDERQKIIETLGNITRLPISSTYGDDLKKMVFENINDLIDFYISIAKDASEGVLIKIDSQMNTVKYQYGTKDFTKIEELSDLIAQNKDYNIFKALFGRDTDFDEDRDFRAGKKLREEIIEESIKEITKDTIADWEKKIIKYVNYCFSTNDNYIHYFNQFLYEFGYKNPDLAKEFLIRNHKKMGVFVIHPMAGMWASNKRNEFKKSLLDWVKKGMYLREIAQLIAYTEIGDHEFLNKVYEKAKEKSCENALVNVIRSVLQLNKITKPYREIFFKAIVALTEIKSASWVNHAWFKQKTFLSKLTKKEIRMIMTNLVYANRIDNQIEHILKFVCKKHPQLIIEFFENRVKHQIEHNLDSLSYDALPFELHRLDEVLRKKRRIIIPAIMSWYKKKNWRFNWEASHLLNNIFPSADNLIEKEMRKIIQMKNRRSVDIVLSILGAYQGQKGLHKTAIRLYKYHQKDKIKYSIFGLLSQTGVLGGEYGFVNAFEGKKSEIQYLKTSPHLYKREFANEYEQYLNERIEYEKKSADEEIELRKRGL